MKTFRRSGFSALWILGCMFIAGSGSPARAQTSFVVTGAPTAWKRIPTPSSPSARAAHAMAYDPVSQKVVLFGGFEAQDYSDETWTFDGSTWTKESPSISPPARAAGVMAFDTVTRTLVLFGGYDGSNYLGDTWVWDGATSQWSHPAGSVAPAPPAVTGPMVFTDPATGHVIVFGGYDGRFYQSETWEWNGTGWVQLQPATVPSARGSAAFGLDPLTGKVVMFGGLAAVNPINTWLWDGTDWQQASPSVQPVYRYDPGAAFDPHLGGVIVFGGGSGGAELNDTWLWTGSDWTSLRIPRSPSARESVGMTFDEALGRIVLFGGLKGNTVLGDTWSLVPGRSTHPGGPAGPPHLELDGARSTR